MDFFLPLFSALLKPGYNTSCWKEGELTERMLRSLSKQLCLVGIFSGFFIQLENFSPLKAKSFKFWSMLDTYGQ